MKVKEPIIHEIHHVALIKFSITNSGTIWDPVPLYTMQWEERDIAYAVLLAKVFNLNLLEKQSDKSNPILAHATK